MSADYGTLTGILTVTGILTDVSARIWTGIFGGILAGIRVN